MCSSNKRKVTFLKDNLFKLAWKTEEKLNKKVELGIVEAAQSKKTYKVRRVGDYLIAGYEKDPLFKNRYFVKAEGINQNEKKIHKNKEIKNIEEIMLQLKLILNQIIFLLFKYTYLFIYLFKVHPHIASSSHLHK